MPSDMNSIFAAFQDHINVEQDLREEIRQVNKDIDQKTREIQTTLQIIHHEGGLLKSFESVPECCSLARKLFLDVKSGFSKLSSIVPDNEYYRFHDHWRFSIQRLAFLGALTIYLESGQMAMIEEVAQLLGVTTKREEGFHIDLEDYLMGLLQLASELARFAVNSVTNGDYKRPLHVSQFVAELNSGFRLLNLKNDGLRKRFDALKYDVKKIEEVVYDLSIRGLKPEEKPEQSAST
ncbi:translin isoform X1 [Frankliniella occidentalis]|uniref:Translin n=1 Tax=Frankliniella occidentalis TaxID=133901 RepID=A0A6J1SS04_FRAOC|nr:translin isoform X1 [Frankliniella occidentalis]